MTRGIVLCRAGHHDEAVKQLADQTDVAALLWRALAEHGSGRPGAAKKALEQAVKCLEAPDADDQEQTNAARLRWHERLEINLLPKEVEALLKDGKPRQPTAG